MKGFYSTVFLFDMGIIMTIELSEEIMKKVTAFKKVIDVALKEEWDEISQYVAFILHIGIHRMIEDVFLEEESSQEIMVSLFEEDPDLISKYIIKRIRDRQLKPEEKWRLDVT